MLIMSLRKVDEFVLLLNVCHLHQAQNTFLHSDSSYYTDH